MFSTVIEYLPGVLAIFCISFLISGFISMISLLIAIESFDTDEALQNVGLTVFTICFMITTWFGCGIMTDIILQKTNVPTYSQRYDALIKEEKANYIKKEFHDNIVKFVDTAFPALSKDRKDQMYNYVVSYIVNNIELPSNIDLKLMFNSEDSVNFYTQHTNDVKSINFDTVHNVIVIEIVTKEKCKNNCNTLHERVTKLNCKIGNNQ